jgi:salicylate hydroxylase
MKKHGTDSEAKAGGRIDIGIIGAGPAGLVAALALEHYVPEDRVRITLLDRNSSAIDYPGVEYGIQARACRALERIDLLERALYRANPCTDITFLNARLKKRFRSIRSDPKYTRCVVRQEFLADLEKLLRYSQVKRLHAVSEIISSTDGTITVRGEDLAAQEGFSRRFDLLVAADGVHSVVRKALFPETAKTHDRGFSCIYMLVEGDETNAPAGFLARANSGTSELIMGHFSTMTMFPLGKGRLALGIGFDHATRTVIWKQHGLPPDMEWQSIPAQQKRSIALRLASDSADMILVEALDLIPDWDSYKIYLWVMRDTDPLPQPYPDTGNVMIIGDAAHAMMPTIGMGASLAIEDAERLAAMIAAAINRTGDASTFRSSAVDEIFAPYANERYPVWNELMRRARVAAVGNFIDVGMRERFAIGPQIPGDTLSRLVSAYERLAVRWNLLWRDT